VPLRTDFGLPHLQSEYRRIGPPGNSEGSMIDRRRLIGGLAAVFLAAASPVQAQTPPLSGVAVDVGRLRAIGLGPFADHLARALYVETQAAFADRIGRSGPRLVVRIDKLQLASYVGESGGGFQSSGTPSDYLEGEALLIGPRGEILASYPQLLALPASSGGAWYVPGGEQRRAEALAKYYAQWLRRKIG
jgi:hypothetical protein